MVSNRTAGILGGAILLGLMAHIEYRLTRLSDQINEIGNIIYTRETIIHTKKDVECLTKNIYYEAGVENRLGKIAVANVTVNRLKEGRWGNNICRVVYAPKQFSWTLNRRLPKPDKQLWAESEQIARQVLSGVRLSGLHNSLYYHADYIKPPKWADNKHYIAQIGQHKFYRQARQAV